MGFINKNSDSETRNSGIGINQPYNPNTDRNSGYYNTQGEYTQQNASPQRNNVNANNGGYRASSQQYSQQGRQMPVQSRNAMPRGNNYVRSGAPVNPVAGSGSILQKVVKWGFIVLFIVEAYYCYMWLIQPLMPFIRNIIENQGVPSLTYDLSGYDIAHPLGNFTVGGMDGDSALVLFKNTSIRIALFGFIFGVTGKVYHTINMMLRS